MSEYHSPQDLQEMWEDAYQQGRVDAIDEFLKIIDDGDAWALNHTQLHAIAEHMKQIN